MVEKIEIIETKKEYEINGKIYTVDIQNAKELIKYQKALDEIGSISKMQEKDIEVVFDTLLEKLRNLINTILNDENACKDIFGSDIENFGKLFDLAIKLIQGSSMSAKKFIDERVKQYEPEQ